MNEQTITVNNIALTHAQVQEAYDKMVKAKAENEIKAGDWIVSVITDMIFKVNEVTSLSIKIAKHNHKKIHCTPEQKAWLDSLIGEAE